LSRICQIICRCAHILREPHVIWQNFHFITFKIIKNSPTSSKFLISFSFIHRHGLAYAADLPYVAHRQNTCSITGNVTKIDVAYFLHPDEQSMIDWLVGFGPVNIGIAVTQDMRAYKGGVFTPSAEDCKNKVIGLHSLLITGYGTSESGEKYWIVKNSWGN
ncbi:papain family cysteine protease, partial [Ancylostoma duodenale]